MAVVAEGDAAGAPIGAPHGPRAGALCPLSELGRPTGPVERVADLPAAVAAWEARAAPRWLWASTARGLPGAAARRRAGGAGATTSS